MKESKDFTPPDWSEDAPDLSSPEWRAKMDKAVVRRGRPRSVNPKELVSLRLDADVLGHFRASGPGWQSRNNETLRRSVNARKGKSR